MAIWGYLQSINLYDVDKNIIKDIEYIKKTLLGLCNEINMIPFKDPYVYRFGEGHLEGVSGMLFIETSSITIHCDEIENRVFIDIFSCKRFNYDKAKEYCEYRFNAKASKHFIIERG